MIIVCLLYDCAGLCGNGCCVVAVIKDSVF